MQRADDPTLRRLSAFAKSLGVWGVLVLNLFALISSSPPPCAVISDPVGIERGRP